MTLSIISTITRSDNMFGVGYDYTSANFAYKAKISSILKIGSEFSQEFDLFWFL